MDHVSTKFGVDSSSHFSFRAWIDRQAATQTDYTHDLDLLTSESKHAKQAQHAAYLLQLNGL